MAEVAAIVNPARDAHRIGNPVGVRRGVAPAGLRNDCEGGQKSPSEGHPFVANATVVCLSHQSHQLQERGSSLPAQRLFRLQRIPAQLIEIDGAVMPRINLNEGASRSPVDPTLVDALAFEDNVKTEHRATSGDEVPNRMHFAGRENVVVARWLLQHKPHPFNVIRGKTPVALSIKITEG